MLAAAGTNWTNIWADASAIVVILGGGVAFIKWLVMPAIRHEIQKVTKDVMGELKPNSGASFRDHVDQRLDLQDVRLERIDRRVSRIERRGDRERA